MRVINSANLPLRAAMAAALVTLAWSIPEPASAAVFRLTATDVVIDQPAPLFTSDNITGFLTLSDDITPSESFGSASILDLTLNFGGITGTLVDIKADIFPGDVQGFGTRSADGLSFSVFDLRFGFPSTKPGCSFFCVGQIIINSPIGPNDPSNFFAFDDFEGDTLSVISSFTPQFGLVPEPGVWAMLVAGFGFVGVGLRRRRGSAAVGPAAG